MNVEILAESKKAKKHFRGQAKFVRRYGFVAVLSVGFAAGCSADVGATLIHNIPTPTPIPRTTQTGPSFFDEADALFGKIKRQKEANSRQVSSPKVEWKERKVRKGIQK